MAKPRIDHVIIPEPLDKDRVCLGHRGVWWAEIETMGRIAHGSMPFDGDCAVRHMAAVLRQFEHELYPQLAPNAPTCRCARWRQAIDAEHQLHHGGESEEFEGCPRRWCRIPAA